MASSVRKRFELILLEASVPVILLGAWWMFSSASNNPFFPPLSSIFSRFYELWIFDHFLSDVMPSIINLLVGFVAAGFFGVVLGVLFALVRPVREIFYPLVNFFRAVPSIALIPIFIILLGFDDEVRVLIIVLAAMPPTLISTLDGIRSVEPTLRDVGHVFRLTSLERIFRIYLPAASPQIFSGLQVTLQHSFILMIATEMLGSSRGIGFMTLLAQQTYASVDMWAGVILLGVLGYFTNLLLGCLRNFSLRWYDGAKQSHMML